MNNNKVDESRELGISDRVIREIKEHDGLELTSDFNNLVEDYISKCGYTREQAIIEARKVSIKDETKI